MTTEILIITAVSILGLNLISQIVFGVLIYRRFNFAGVKSKLENQIKSLEQTVSDSSAFDDVKVVSALDSVRDAINNISITDSTKRVYPDIKKLVTNQLFEVVEDFDVILGNRKGKIYLLRDKQTRQEIFASEDFNIAPRLL